MGRSRFSPVAMTVVMTVAYSCVFTFLFLALTACRAGEGKTGQTRSIGIDGYVYVAEKISDVAEKISGEGGISQEDSLFSYAYGMEAPEVPFYPSNLFVRDGEGNFYFLSCNYSISDVAGSAWNGAINIEIPGRKYIIYPDGSLQTQESGKEGISLTNPGQKELADVRALAHTVLYKTSAQGEILYGLDLTQQLWGMSFSDYYTCLAIHKSGTLMVLTENGILMVDREGRFAGVMDTPDEVADCFPDGYTKGAQYLAGGMDGSVYYVAMNGSDMAVYEVTEKGSFGLSRAEAFTGRKGNVYPGLKGILFSDHQDGILYEYKGDGSLVPVLRWQDSNLYEAYIQDVIQVSEEELLAEVLNFQDGTHTFYHLKRTALADLPEKEEIVLASLTAYPELERSIAEFNRESQKYHVIYENYGALSDFSAALTRLDSSLAGSDPPDILDLTNLSIYKFAQKDALEDLAGYLGESSRVHKEDYLENVVNGFTIGGKLVCIPTSFYFMTLMGREEQLGDTQGWTMKECMELTEHYPELSLAAGWSSQSLFSWCREFCLERFVDWDKGTCRFDSTEFQELLAWLGTCGEKGGASGDTREDSLLFYSSFETLWGLIQKEEELGEKLVLTGFPTTDGKVMHRPVTRGALAMVSKSVHKEGAWAFIEYYLSEYNYIPGTLFPTGKNDFQGMIEYYTTPDYILDEHGERQKQMDGTYLMGPKVFLPNGERYYYLEEEQFADVLQAIESLDFTPAREEEDIVMDIVEEETGYYFDGSKDLGEVADIIQNRVSVLLGEG